MSGITGGRSTASAQLRRTRGRATMSFRVLADGTIETSTLAEALQLASARGKPGVDITIKPGVSDVAIAARKADVKIAPPIAKPQHVRVCKDCHGLFYSTNQRDKVCPFACGTSGLSNEGNLRKQARRGAILGTLRLACKPMTVREVINVICLTAGANVTKVEHEQISKYMDNMAAEGLIVNIQPGVFAATRVAKQDGKTAREPERYGRARAAIQATL